MSSFIAAAQETVRRMNAERDARIAKSEEAKAYDVISGRDGYPKAAEGYDPTLPAPKVEEPERYLGEPRSYWERLRQDELERRAERRKVEILGARARRIRSLVNRYGTFLTVSDKEALIAVMAAHPEEFMEVLED